MRRAIRTSIVRGDFYLVSGGGGTPLFREKISRDLKL